MALFLFSVWTPQKQSATAGAGLIELRELEDELSIPNQDTTRKRRFAPALIGNVDQWPFQGTGYYLRWKMEDETAQEAEALNVGSNIEVLILNGQVVLSEGELIDWTGDGVIDGSDQAGFLTNFTGISSLTLGDRDANGFVNLAFTADINLGGTILEGGFGFMVSAAVPEPSSIMLLLAGTGLALTRRSKS